MKNTGKSLGCLLIFALLIVTSIWYRSSTDIITITVKSKERIAEKDRGRYLVWAQEGEVFQISDTIIFGQFSSSDIYGQLETNKKYKVKVTGWRIPIFSSYRNIISIISSE